MAKPKVLTSCLTPPQNVTTATFAHHCSAFSVLPEAALR